MRLAIFDFDGTLADTRLNIVLTMRETMRELRLPEADEAACAATIGLRLRDGFARLLPGVADETLDRCVSTYRRLFDERKRTMPKPAPDAVLAILRRLDVPPSGALVVGDMPVDVEMGRAAGVRTCGVLWGNATREQLAAAGADFLAATMDDILALA